jgi:hypothetical protein
MHLKENTYKKGGKAKLNSIPLDHLGLMHSASLQEPQLDHASSEYL